ncbi:hypothetical protein [Rhodomicrobium lacus]|uniref:hypothetical protein n=1 Tax=Rhodomicrobium lacus TaxID=2498452 RepID=UPI000F8E5B17|nr:hypothetical protein [Rhodomicrobium lacus]
MENRAGTLAAPEAPNKKYAALPVTALPGFKRIWRLRAGEGNAARRLRMQKHRLTEHEAQPDGT